MIPESQSFEAHITIEPVFGNRLALFEELADRYNFKVAKLLLQKDREVTAERSDRDSFCTGHDTNFDNMLNRTMDLFVLLRDSGFKVWRYKIESILLDKRLK